MQIYCDKCRFQQVTNERYCSKCGAPFWGELWVLIMGVLLAISLPTVLIMSGNASTLLDAWLFFWYELPVLLGTAFLYDYNPKRRSLYFWGGSVVIIGSVFMLR